MGVTKDKREEKFAFPHKVNMMVKLISGSFPWVISKGTEKSVSLFTLSCRTWRKYRASMPYLPWGSRGRMRGNRHDPLPHPHICSEVRYHGQSVNCLSLMDATCSLSSGTSHEHKALWCKENLNEGWALQLHILKPYNDSLQTGIMCFALP